MQMERRYKILAISSMVLFSFYFAYDIPAALNKHLELDAHKITLLYSAYAFPNMVVPIFFGWSMKIRPYLAVSLCSLVFLGQFIFAWGVYLKSFKTMLIGRFVFGIGGESFTVVQNKIIARQFKGRELAFSMAVFSGIARLGTVTNFLVTPMLAARFNKMVCCVLGGVLTMSGLILCMLMNKKGKVPVLMKNSLKPVQEKIDEFEDKVGPTLSKEIEGFCKDPVHINTFISIKADDPKESPKEEDNVCLYDTILNLKQNDKICSFSPSLGDSFSDSANSEALKKENNIFEEERPFKGFPGSVKKKLELERPNALFKEADTLYYDPPLRGKGAYHSTFGLLVAISFMFAVVWAPFYNIAALLFQKRYNVGIIEAGRMMAMVEGTSLLLVFVIGYLADALGIKLLLVGMGGVVLILAHTLIFFKIGSPYIAVMLLGISAPLISCYWPCITYLVSPESMGTGFAIISCVLNVAYTFSPGIVSILISRDSSFDSVEFFIILVSSMALVSIVILCLLDAKFSLGLNKRDDGIND